MHELVKLETRDGAHVGWITIPKLRPCADVLWWSERFFRFRDIKPGKPGHLQYVEAFTVAITAPVTGEPPEAAR